MVRFTEIINKLYDFKYSCRALTVMRPYIIVSNKIKIIYFDLIALLLATVWASSFPPVKRKKHFLKAIVPQNEKTRLLEISDIVVKPSYKQQYGTFLSDLLLFAHGDDQILFLIYSVKYI